MKPPVISEPLEASIPLGYCGVVDRRRGDHLFVEHDREVLQRLGLGDARQLRVFAAVGDFLGDPFEHRLAVFVEAEGHVRQPRAAAFALVALLRVVDAAAFEHRVVVEHVEAVGFGLDDLVLEFFGARLHEHGAGVDVHGLRDRAGGRFVAVGVQLGLRVGGAADRLAAGAEHLFVLGVDQIPRAVDAAVDLRGCAALFQRGRVGVEVGLAFGGEQHRFVLG